MPKPFTPQIVTANALLEGDVIYQTATGWSRDLKAAEVLHHEADAELRLIDALQQPDHVVGAYLTPINPEGPAPVHFREAFRAKGPSNYAHGKQEAS